MAGQEEVRKAGGKSSKGAATSCRKPEVAIPVGGTCCLARSWFSSDLAVGSRPTLDQHPRKGELAQRMSEEEQVAEKAGSGEDQARRAFVGYRHEGARAEADDGGGDESEKRRD